MLDDMFSFIDPIVDPILEPTAEDLALFIAQIDAFLDAPETRARLPMATPRPLTEETYKEMWMLRCQQHLGQITFLELLSKYEEILGIPPPSQPAQ
jgi:hypothetical protein